MRETVTLTGMVLISAPSGDYDRRLVLLTRERGRITAFSHGARESGNALMAASRPFSFGTFSMYKGRSVYNLQSAQIANYFGGPSMDVKCTCYGSYFLEIADYFSQESMDGTEVLRLLCQPLRALLKLAVPNYLVGRIFELKTTVINEEYTETPPSLVSEFYNRAWEYVVCSPVGILYRFILKRDMMREFDGTVDESRKYYVYCESKSLRILDMLTA